MQGAVVDPQIFPFTSVAPKPKKIAVVGKARQGALSKAQTDKGGGHDTTRTQTLCEWADKTGKIPTTCNFDSCVYAFVTALTAVPAILTGCEEERAWRAAPGGGPSLTCTRTCPRVHVDG